MYKSIFLFTFVFTSLSFCSDVQKNDRVMELYSKANVYYQNKELDKALDLYNKIIDLDSSFTNARFMKAKVLFYSKKVKESREVLEKILEQDNDNISALLLDSKIDIIEKVDYKITIEKLNKILLIDPDHLEAHTLLGLLYENNNNNQKALREYLLIIDKQYDIISAHINLAILYKKIGLLNRSANHLKTAKELSKASNYSTEYVDSLIRDLEK